MKIRQDDIDISKISIFPQAIRYDVSYIESIFRYIEAALDFGIYCSVFSVRQVSPFLTPNTLPVNYITYTICN